MSNIPEYEIFVMLCMYPLMFVAGIGAVILLIQAVMELFESDTGMAVWHLIGTSLATGYLAYSWHSLQDDNMTLTKLMVLILGGTVGMVVGMLAFENHS